MICTKCSRRFPDEEDGNTLCSGCFNLEASKPDKKMREFESGATRDDDTNKLQFAQCLSPLVLVRYAQYIREHCRIPIGFRTCDNWKKGMPKQAYMDSLLRHIVEAWKLHELKDEEALQESLCGVMFNTMGFLYEILKRKKVE